MADTITRVGLAAGEIWHFVDHKGGKSSLPEILASLNYPLEFVLLGLGWLAREGQAFLEEKDGSFKVIVNKR